ncbi:hypothetical protein [uncultured Brachyspira sp.]|uniref:hypothetical protein n=1 Tax=uncultured Brachyspira sp. TaxID=221953 RepID=UPI00259AAC8B|nr:hypothetical protein [uncultured Brachyspira sp.]
MKEKVLKEIHDYLVPILFKNREYDLIKTLKESSYSEANYKYMTESTSLVIKCENLIAAYCIYKNRSDNQSKSVDAIYKFENKKIYLIEFKSGAVKGKNILNKGKSVFKILEDLNFFDDKKYLSYIVVYNPKDIPESSELEDITDIILDFSINTKEKYKDYKNKELHNIYLLEEKFFNESYFCTKNDFNNYVVKEFEEEEK